MLHLKLYAVFHLNLAYSSIEENLRPEVIRKCYWPLLHLAEEYALPIGIEASGYTLETIAALDPGWIMKLHELTGPGHCELVGSGYAQIIGPLVPAEVNHWNQRLGLQTYQDILGMRPAVALVNEMAYSAGLVEIYQGCGYRAAIMEWNNPRKYHPEWEALWRYFPQRAAGAGASEIPLIWADSIIFQKLQRYAHGEMTLSEYLDSISVQVPEVEGYLPLYANDVEIFDFRPGRYRTEAAQGNTREWDRIARSFSALKNRAEFGFISPSAVLEGLDDRHGGHRIHLESPEQPIPVKKQEKYNINRWALTGRDDLGSNTACHQIYQGMRAANPMPEDWKELCYLWSSDFRTHITPLRWAAYRKRLQEAGRKWQRKEVLERKTGRPVQAPVKSEGLSIEEDDRFLAIETDKVACSLDKTKGLVFKTLVFKDIRMSPLIGTLPHGYYEDISLAADFFSGHTIIEVPGEHKITDLSPCTGELTLYERMLQLRAEIEAQAIHFNKTIAIDLTDGTIVLGLDLRMPSRMLATIRLLNMTLIPTSFSQRSVFFATHLGGESLETFRIGSGEIHHARGLSALISAQHGLGTTAGEIIIGDADKRLIFHHDQSCSALIAHVHFLPVQSDQYFLRLQYSAQEMDETFREDPQPLHIRCRLRIRGEACAGPEESLLP